MNTAHEDPPVQTLALNANEFRMDARYQVRRSQGSPNWLLIVCLEGSGYVESKGAKVITTPGMATLYSPDTPQTYGTVLEIGYWHFLWAHFHCRPQWAEWLHWPTITKGLHSLALNDSFVFNEASNALRESITFLNTPRSSSLDLAINAFERTLLWMNSVNTENQIDGRVRQALKIIGQEFQTPMPLSQLAKDCGLSLSRFAHLFSEQIGMPPQQYLEEIRLQRALHLLRSTDYRIQEIAELCGYPNAFYFSSRFRKRFGKAPTASRQQSEVSVGPIKRDLAKCSTR